MARFRALNVQRLSESSGSNTDQRCTTACVQVLDFTERQAIRAGADKDQGDPLLGGNKSQTEVKAKNILE